MPALRNPTALIIYLSLLLVFAFLLLARPPIPFYALPLAPIALAAVWYGFTGGTLVAVAAMVGAALVIALDPAAARRAMTLQEAWPILIMYLVVGPLVGWLATRERERKREQTSIAGHLRVVQAIAQAINTDLDLEHTLQTVIAETRELVPFAHAAVMLHEVDSLRVIAVSDDRRQPTAHVGQTFTVADSAAGRVVQRRQVWLGQPADIARYPDTQLLCSPPEECVMMPLQLQRRVTGVFVLSGEGLAEISEVDLDNLSQITGQMTVAIEHARLFESERQRSRQMAAISDACREIAVSLNLERTLKLVMAKAVETLPMDAGALFQFDLDSQTYRVVVSHNLSSEHVERITFAFEEGVPGWVVKHRQSLIIPEVATDARVHPYVVEEGVLSVLATPLVAREQVVGVLNLYCKTNVNAFDDEAMRLAEVFGAQAAIAIENARLVEELRRAAVELEARVEHRTQELRETQAQIIRAEKMAVVGRLAGSVAHEVNNPLQAIALQLQLISGEGLPEPASQRMSIVQEELARIAGIVQRLLDFQHPTLGKREVHRIPALVDDILALSDKQLQQHDVTVIRKDQADLEPVLVAGNQMKQVFLNLVLNAIEAMPDGGQLQIRTQKSNGMISVAFSDSGIGMTPEVMEHLFEPFFSTKTNGSGLGLAVSHKIVTQHSGTLEAAGQPDQGSSFTVRLPVYRESNEG